MTPSDKRLIAMWLVVCCLLVFSMIVLGGITRLTQSGLSMVDWDPIMGAIPPLNEREWQEAFEQYQEFPEYQVVNKDMSLAGFKSNFLCRVWPSNTRPLHWRCVFSAVSIFSVYREAESQSCHKIINDISARWGAGTDGVVYGEKRAD